MTNHNHSVTNLVSDIDKLMDSLFPSSIFLISSKGSPLRWTRKTVTYDETTYVTAIQDDTGNQDGNDRVATATETRTLSMMGPYPPATLYPVPIPLPTAKTTLAKQATLEETFISGSMLQTTLQTEMKAPPDSIQVHHGPHGLPSGVIAAIAVCTILSTVLMAIVAWLCIKQRRKQREEEQRAMSLDNTMMRPRQDSHPSSAEQTDERLTLEPNSWLSLQNISVTGDPRETLSQGVRSPTPKPAVAEMQSFVRAGQKPRVYTVGERTFPQPEATHDINR